jgi:hypothetical protein
MINTLSRWAPPPDVTDHTEQPLSGDLSFFEPPPVEIGRIYTAYSSLTARDDPYGKGSRIAWAVGVAIFGAVLGLIAAYYMEMTDTASVLGFLGVPLALGSLLGYYGGKKGYTCSYVGEEGVATFSFSGDPAKLKRIVFPFSAAEYLRTTQTRHFTNGVYQGTNYSFTWTNASGALCFTLSGRYNDQKMVPPGDQILFARASELFWTYHLYARAQRTLSLGGTVQFPLLGNDFVRVGMGYLELQKGGKSTHCEAADIAQMTITQGVFTLRRKDAKSGFLGIGASGTFQFEYANLANARLFLVLLKQFGGIEVN